MANKQLIDWLKVGRKKGYSLRYLKDILVQNSWQEKDIEQATDKIAKPKSSFQIGSATFWIVPLIVIVIVAGSVFFLHENGEQNYLTSDKIKTKILEATSGIKSYASNSTTNTSLIVSIDGKSNILSILNIQKGIVDFENNAYYLSSESKNDFFKMNSEIFLSDNKIYAYFTMPGLGERSNSKWIKADLNSLPEAFKNIYLKILDKKLDNLLIQSSEIEILEKDPLHIKLKVDKKIFIDQYNQLLQGLGEQGKLEALKKFVGLNISDRFIDNLDTQYWLDESFRPVKVSTNLKLSLNSSDLESLPTPTPSENEFYLPSKSAYSELGIVLSVIEEYSGYNSQNKITIPEEAVNAEEDALTIALA